jgi:hypothetical protein
LEILFCKNRILPFASFSIGGNFIVHIFRFAGVPSKLAVPKVARAQHEPPSVRGRYPWISSSFFVPALPLRHLHTQARHSPRDATRLRDIQPVFPPPFNLPAVHFHFVTNRARS